MPKNKANIKEILAANLRETRRKKGLTQEKLAEMANISLRYLAMLELRNSFPSGEMLEKLSDALDIQAFQLFYPSSTPEGAMLHLEQSIVSNIEKTVSAKLTQPENDLSIKKEFEQLRHDIIQDIKNIYDDKLEKSFVFNIENVVKMSVKQAVASEFKNLKKNK
ncbi:helix-turn-helix domain-containing protein [Treponema sp. R80B11-R83G3]